MSCGGRAASQPGQNGLKKFLRQLLPESANPAAGGAGLQLPPSPSALGRSEKLQYRARGLTAQRQANAE